MADKDNAVLEALQGIQATLTGISQRQEAQEGDIATLMENQEKLNARINDVAAATGGVSGAVSAEQLAAVQAKLEEVENNPMLTRDPEKIKKRHAQQLKRAGEREREAGVHSMWHPELNPAKRDGLPLCKVVRTRAEQEEARGMGYVDSLDEAADILVATELARVKREQEAFDHNRKTGQPAIAPVPTRYGTKIAAKTALHRAEQSLARAQISQQPAQVAQAAPQPQAASAA